MSGHIRILGILILLGFCAATFGDIINVPGDQPTIQAAIDAASDGDDIVVAPGTYFENINLLGKAVNLHSSDGPAVTTIDANGSGTVIKCISGEGPGTIIDGFTITGGNADADYPNDRGGGMRNEASSPTVMNCAFTENSAFYAGGGMANASGSSPAVTYCTFGGNTTVWQNGRGGGMYNDGASPTLDNCTFIENSSGSGGGMHNIYESNPTLTNCTFTGNSAGSNGSGGGMWNFGSSTSPTKIINCTFEYNDGGAYGGGMTNGGLLTTIINCRFFGNSAVYGGGMVNYDGGATVSNCVFSGNTATSFGGAMMNDKGPNHDGGPKVVNCTFNGNSAGYSGGGLLNSATTAVVNCTFTGNSVINGDGGAIYNTYNSSNLVVNCILWNNSPNEIYAGGTVLYSDVQGGWPGVGNIDADPLFIDADGPDDVPGTEDDNLRASPGSPVIDAGFNAFVPFDTSDLDGDGDTDEHIPFDLDGNPRFVDGDGNNTIVVDMGAYEFQGTPCPADFNGDEHVGAEDLAQLLGSWGPCPGCPADLNGDGSVGAFDLALLLGAWGPCP